MAVTIKLPTQLRDAAGGATSTSVEGSTVGEALEALYSSHGELRGRLADPGFAPKLKPLERAELELLAAAPLDFVSCTARRAQGPKKT